VDFPAPPGWAPNVVGSQNLAIQIIHLERSSPSDQFILPVVHSMPSLLPRDCLIGPVAAPRRRPSRHSPASKVLCPIYVPRTGWCILPPIDPHHQSTARYMRITNLGVQCFQRLGVSITCWWFHPNPNDPFMSSPFFCKLPFISP